MIHVPFDPDTLAGEPRGKWDKLLERAQKATQAVLDAEDGPEPPPLNQEIWKGFKEFMFKHAFHGKCAYCESDLSGHSFGDAEHWRPKSEVRRADGSLVAGHKGYARLAHEWENLIPSCQPYEQQEESASRSLASTSRRRRLARLRRSSTRSSTRCCCIRSTAARAIRSSTSGSTAAGSRRR